MKRYKITLPTPERCTERGIKFEGLATRTQLWLMGVASGVAYASVGYTPARFNLFLVGKNSFDVETNSHTIITRVTDYLEAYGCTVAETIPVATAS